MSENSGIEWTDHTFNIVWGCTKVSPGCKNCYAEAWAKRYGVAWGPTAERRVMSDTYWREPLKWNRKAQQAGKRAKVFCGSMCDILEDHKTVNEQRPRLYQLIKDTPWLDWLLLTKRIENASNFLPDEWMWWGMPQNVWLGTTTENQNELDARWPVLESIARVYKPSVVWLSIEPLLGPINLRDCFLDIDLGDEEHSVWTRPVDWVIVGGESGPGARSMHISWALSLVDQCYRANVPVFVKQLGASPIDGHPGMVSGYPISDRKGKNMAEWPTDLRVREFPEVPQ